MSEAASMFDGPLESPGDVLRRKLDERGWTQDEFADITGKPRPAITEIISGRRGVTPEMAMLLSDAFGGETTPEYWLNLEIRYRLSKIERPEGDSTVHRRGRIFAIAPVREMQRRGWIASPETLDETESELAKFFDVPSLAQEIQIGAVTRKSDAGEPLNVGQRAWCFRVRQLAKAQLVGEYSEAALPKLEKDLRTLAAYPQETHKVPLVLAKYGIRFAIVEPLQSTKVDGVAMWLDATSPVIGMSLRYDRVDSFWFTLCHELSHIKHRDEAPLDGQVGDHNPTTMIVVDKMERRANEDAANTLIPKDEIESFIKRVGPLYSKDRIVRFANRIKIHPGIIVGQLQRRDEIGYASNREMLVKVRHVVTPTSITDGWGHSIDPRSFK